jgi:hypothetical protein
MVMFCPKCSRQYQEGEQECTECEVPLMEEIYREPSKFGLCIFLNILSVMCLVFSIIMAQVCDSLVICYLFFVVFGAIVFAYFLHNDCESLFVLPLAWGLNILYVVIIFLLDQVGFIFIGFGVSIGLLYSAIYFILPNIIYSLLLAVIYWRIRKKRIKNNLEREG